MIITFPNAVILLIEFIAFETGSDSVSSRHNPLQKGVWFVVCRCSINYRIRQIGVSFNRYKWRAVSPEFGEATSRFDCIPGDTGVGRMDMTMIATIILPRTVESFMCIKPSFMIDIGTFGKFA